MDDEVDDDVDDDVVRRVDMAESKHWMSAVVIICSVVVPPPSSSAPSLSSPLVPSAALEEREDFISWYNSLAARTAANDELVVELVEVEVVVASCWKVSKYYYYRD